MIQVNSINKWMKNVIELDKKAVLLSSPVVTYRLSQEAMNKEFDKYSKKTK